MDMWEFDWLTNISSYSGLVLLMWCTSYVLLHIREGHG